MYLHAPTVCYDDSFGASVYLIRCSVSTISGMTLGQDPVERVKDMFTFVAMNGLQYPVF